MKFIHILDLIASFPAHLSTRKTIEFSDFGKENSYEASSRTSGGSNSLVADLPFQAFICVAGEAFTRVALHYN